MSTATYEWDIETFDPATGDILDHDFADTLGDLMTPLRAFEPNQRLVLVRNDDSGRQWAYIKDGKLPEFFSVPEADGNEYETATPVPRRFHREWNAK